MSELGYAVGIAMPTDKIKVRSSNLQLKSRNRLAIYSP